MNTKNQKKKKKLAILIISNNKDLSPWINSFKEKNKALAIRIYPNIGNPSDIKMALVWSSNRVDFAQFNNLKCVASMGAGVNHITVNKTISSEVVITKIIDNDLVYSMWEYLQNAVSNIRLNTYSYIINQSWNQKNIKLKQDITIGIMGLGQLGSYVAKKFKDENYIVKGYSNSIKNIEGIKCYKSIQIDDFLANVDVLINLMPYTKATKDYFDKEFFCKCKKGLYFINVGRGKSVVDEHLYELINDDFLSGATLDVFRTEPLPSEHIFYKNSKIIVTPHIASITNPASVINQILVNYNNILNNNELINKIDRSKDY